MKSFEELCYKMKDKGWCLNALQFPSSVHICVTNMHNNNISEQFIKDLTESVNTVFKNSKGKVSSGDATIYGSSQKVSDRNIIKLISKEYLDCYYTFNF